MTGHLIVYKAADGWRWRAVAGNGETVATGEAHPRKWNAKRAAKAAFPDWPLFNVRTK